MDCLDNLDNIVPFVHIVVATIFVICLKRNPYILALLLTGILGYTIYSEKNALPIYLLPALGCFTYILDSVVINKNITIESAAWKIPYWSIISYYVIMATLFTKKLNTKTDW